MRPRSRGPEAANETRKQMDFLMLAATTETLTAELDRGTISAKVESYLIPAHENVRGSRSASTQSARSYSFLKVLGRHIPVKPSTMRRTYQLLASQIPGDVAGPVIFIGMAETAVGLGKASTSNGRMTMVGMMASISPRLAIRSGFRLSASSGRSTVTPRAI